jgi:hypothetical protein
MWLADIFFFTFKKDKRMNDFIPIIEDNKKDFCYEYAKELNFKGVNCCLKKNEKGDFVLWRELSDENLKDVDLMLYVNSKSEKDKRLRIEDLKPNKKFLVKEK